MRLQARLTDAIGTVVLVLAVLLAIGFIAYWVTY